MATKIRDAILVSPQAGDLFAIDRPSSTDRMAVEWTALVRGMPSFDGDVSSSVVVTNYITAEAYFQDVAGRAAVPGDMFLYNSGYSRQLWVKWYLAPQAIWSFVNIDGSVLEEI